MNILLEHPVLGRFFAGFFFLGYSYQENSSFITID